MAKSSWGTKRQRAKGSWELRYRVGGKQKSVMFRGTAREADRQLAALRLKYEGGGGPRTSAVVVLLGRVRPPVRAAPGSPAGVRKQAAGAHHVQGLREVLQAQHRADVRRDGAGGHKGQGRAGVAVGHDVRHRQARQGHLRAPRRRQPRRGPGVHRPPPPGQAVHHAHRQERAPAQLRHLRPDELESIFRECSGELWEPYYILAAFGGAQRAEAIGVQAPEIEWRENERGLWAVCPVNRGVHLLDGEVTVLDRAKNDYRAEPLDRAAAVLGTPQGDRRRGPRGGRDVARGRRLRRPHRPGDGHEGVQAVAVPVAPPIRALRQPEKLSTAPCSTARDTRTR